MLETPPPPLPLDIGWCHSEVNRKNERGKRENRKEKDETKIKGKQILNG
jgi:hypothetical protein